MTKDIGGYIEFGINTISEPYHKDALAINSARNGIVYAIHAYDIKEIYVPYYTCPVVWQAIEKTGCKLKFYNINELLLPAQDFEEDAYIVYTNYFGICAKNVKTLAKKYKNLIVEMNLRKLACRAFAKLIDSFFEYMIKLLVQGRMKT